MTDAPALAPGAPSSPRGLPLLSALTLLGAVPLGSAIFVVFAQSLSTVDDPYFTADNAVSEAWAMGGWPMYAVLGVGVLASLAVAVFVVFAARQNALFALPLPFFVAVPAAIGAAGTSQGLSGAILAVAHASPGDRATILAGSAGEALWCSTLGACIAAGLALATTAALVLAGFAQRRRSEVHGRGLFLGAVVTGALLVMAWLGATTTQTASSTWLALAHSARSVELVSGVVEGLMRAQSHLALAALMTLAVSAVLAAAARGAPGGARVALVVSASLGVGVLFVSTRARPSKDVVEAFASSVSDRPLYVFDSPTVGTTMGVPLGSEVNDDVEMLLQQARDLHAAADDYGYEDRAAFELQPDVSARSVRAALEQAAQVGVRDVTLLTGAPHSDVSLPPPFDSVVRRQPGVMVKLLYRESDCPCDELTVEANGVRLGDEVWTFGPAEEKYVERFAPMATLKLDESLTVELLLRTAVAAVAHGHQFGLVLEGTAPGRPKASLFDDPAEAYEPPAPLAEATLVDVKVLTGPLSAATLKPRARLDRIVTCVEADDVLPVTVEFEAVLSVTGSVLDTRILGRDERDDFASCVTALFQLDDGDPVAGFTIVRMKVKFAPPKAKQ